VHTGEPARVRLAPTSSIEGSVRGTNLTVDDLIVNVGSRTDYTRTERFFRTQHYAIHDLPSGTYTLLVETGGHERRRKVEVAEGEHKTGVDFDFDTGASVTGRVVDLFTQRPLAGAKVVANVPGPESTAYDRTDPDRRALSDSSGRFRLERVPSGVFEVNVFIPGGWVPIVKSIDGIHDIDLGDIAIATVRSKEPGTIGIGWQMYADDVEMANRALVVKAIDPSGPAAATDLRVGDVVTTIDGYDIRGDRYWNGFVLLEVSPGTTLQLGLARGVTVAITTR
jgi:hypothetical protein